MQAINTQVLVKGQEKWVVIWRDGRGQDARRQLCDWAMQPDLDFSWYDAIQLAKAIYLAERREAEFYRG